MDPQTIDLIQTIAYLLPVGGLVWKAASMASEIKVLRRDMTRLQTEVSDEKNATDSAISTLTNMLTDIKIAVTRIETKLESRKNTGADSE